MGHVRPEVALIDLAHPDDGAALAREVLDRGIATSILLIAGAEHREAILAALVRGASGSVPPDATPRALQDAILAVARGGAAIDPAVGADILATMRNGASHPADDAFASLSPQEERILDLIADGATNAGIASTLGLAEKTVKNYVSHIYLKLNVRRRSQAARLAAERRLRPRNLDGAP